MSSYIVDISVSMTVSANSEEEAFAIGHGQIDRIRNNETRSAEVEDSVMDVDGEVVDVEEA